MAITTILAIYFIIWWTVLFAVLPFGVRSQHEAGDVVPGSDPGAPAIHRVWGKMLWTTVIASVIFAIFYVVYTQGLIPYEWLSSISGPPRRY